MFAELSGSYDICKICFWEDDRAQLRWPNLAGGANSVPLLQAQRNYIECGATESRFVSHVRSPLLGEPIDDGWRVIDLAIDSFESKCEEAGEWPDDYTSLYWWRDVFWRRDSECTGRSGCTDRP